MSARRRRWSSQHLDSLISFQNKSRDMHFTEDSFEITADRAVDTQEESELLRSSLLSDNDLIDLDMNTQKDLMQFSVLQDPNLMQFSLLEDDNEQNAEKTVNLDGKICVENKRGPINQERVTHEDNVETTSSKENQSDINATSNNQKLIEFTEIIVEHENEETKSDIWSTLTALEQVLNSPKVIAPQQPPQVKEPHSRILQRLSREFKNTPSKFTERLLSIIEESVLSSESPNKHTASATKDSTVNVHNMTSEFRKLCKFIEDESMPEWSSTLNMTALDVGSQTPVFKNKNSNNKKNSHANGTLTPEEKANTSAVIDDDKFFEYWEAVCNMVCPQKNEKQPVLECPTPESARANMNNMLSICERQLASLDDSSIDIRSSAPLPPVEFEPKIVESPRPKSTPGLTCEYKAVDISNLESPFVADFVSDNDDIMVEVIKRRQRCFDTARLMLEIDGEDNISSEDKKCVDYLYKLGIQEKTMLEVETDVQMLSTLNQCLDYRSYLTNKGGTIRNILQNRIAKMSDKRKSGQQALESERKVSISTPRSIQKSETPSSKPRSSLAKSVLTKNMLSVNSTPLSSSPRRNLTRQNSTPSTPASPLRHVTKDKPIAKTPTYPKNSPLTKNQPLFRSSPNLRATPQFLVPTSKAGTSSNVTQKSLSARRNEFSSPGGKHSTPQSPMTRSMHFAQPFNTWSTPKSTQKLTPSSHARVNVNSPKIKEESPSLTADGKYNFFVSPGNKPAASFGARKKPTTYFSSATKRTPQKLNTDSIKSPIGLYIHGLDTNLVKNIRSKTNDLLLTPTKEEGPGKTPKLKFNLSSKENKSPVPNRNEIVLPRVHYQPSDQILTEINKQKLTSSAKMRTLLKPLQNQVIIRHEGRKVDEDKITETSIRVQKVAAKNLKRH